MIAEGKRSKKIEPQEIIDYYKERTAHGPKVLVLLNYRRDTKEKKIMRGHIRQRSARSHTVYLETDKDPLTGKRRQEIVTVQGSREAAEEELTRLLHTRKTSAACSKRAR